MTRDPHLFQVQSYATHFILVNNTAYDKILQAKEEPIDVFYKKNLFTYCTYPHIAIQKESKSDVYNTNVNYTKFFKESSKVLERSLKGNADLIALGLCIIVGLLLLKTKFSKK